MANATILADGRWRGTHGIGRFAQEVLSRLSHTDILSHGPHPLSLPNLLWQPWFLRKRQGQTYKVFFNPGFNPTIKSAIPVVLTIHDLIHLAYPGRAALAKQWFYQTMIKPAARNSYRVLTVSQYSKQAIMSWARLADDQVTVVGNGVSAAFTPLGERHVPGFPYVLHVGNSKPHKNIERLIQAFASAPIDKKIKLIFTSALTKTQWQLIGQLGLSKRCLVASALSESTLASYYRGALGLLLPSLYEGFGLPVIEAMACGTPVLTSDVTALPEVAGNAALRINPYDLDALREGIAQLINHETNRSELIKRGYARAALYSWDNVAQSVQAVLDTL